MGNVGSKKMKLTKSSGWHASASLEPRFLPVMNQRNVKAEGDGSSCCHYGPRSDHVAQPLTLRIRSVSIHSYLKESRRSYSTLAKYRNTQSEAGLNYSSAIQDVLIKEIKRCTDKTKMEQLMNASFNLDRAWTTKAARTHSAGWKFVHDWEDELAHIFERGMYEKL
ncbi:hypothetical protein ABVK25_001219 [Lepraria finkii]|uniref:Uncharacterized protein n=1 Tax=Lepraria finkii TaxID=1340010 RepID=A0ABR4BN85_9LECA